MALARYEQTLQDAAGNIIQNATVTVRNESGGALATLYSDRAGATPKSNPFSITASDNGLIAFHVVGGAYKITAVATGGDTKERRYVGIGTAAENDLPAVATQAVNVTFAAAGNVSSTTVQAAIEELDTEKQIKSNPLVALALAVGVPLNCGLAAAVGSSALTVSVKGADGNDPSASNPVVIPFRSATAATGTPSFLTLTSALSLVITSGSTMGFTSAVKGRLWVVIFNDAGTPRLGLVNARSSTSIMALRDGIYSSTAEGGAGGADSAQVIYTGTAVTSKAMAIIGYIEATEATAGTWATAPSLLQLRTPGMPLPGDTVQTQRTDTGAMATGTTTIPNDDTIPQSGEGTQFMTQAVTPTSECNLLKVVAEAQIGMSASVQTIMALFRDAVANALVAVDTPGLTGGVWLSLNSSQLAGSTSATTFKIRAGGASASTLTFNGYASARLFGGVKNSFMEVTEVMA